MKQYVPMIEHETGNAIMVEADNDDYKENKQTYIITPDVFKIKTLKMTEKGYLSSLRFNLIVGLISGVAIGVMLLSIIAKP